MPTKSLSATIFGVDQASPVFQKVGKSAQDMAGQTEQASNRMGSAMAKGAKMAAGALAAVGFAQFAKDTIKQASDMEQNIGAVQAVFKSATGEIEKFGATSSSTVGIAKQDYFQLAAVFGSQLKNMGIAADQLAPQTNKLVTLGADLAAVYGGTASDAVEAISALLRGERDPIERYGVSIKQASINGYELAKGLDTSTAAAKTNADMQATLALLFQQTGDAQGQFADQTDTLAESQQIATAKFKEAQAEIGQKLLPIITNLTTFAADDLVPVLSVVADGLGKVIDVIDAIPGPVKAALLAMAGWKTFASTRVFARLSAEVTGFGESMALQTSLARAQGVELTRLGAISAATRVKLSGVGSSLIKGGAWAAAFAAAPIAIDLVTKALHDATPEAHDFTDAIDQQTGVLKDNWKQLIATKLAQDGTIDLINKAGISVADYTAALMGNDGAYRRVAAAAKAHWGGENAADKVLQQLYVDRQKYTEQINRGAQAAKAAAEIERQFAEATRDSATSTGKASSTLTDYLNSLEKHHDDATAAATAEAAYAASLSVSGRNQDASKSSAVALATEFGNMEAAARVAQAGVKALAGQESTAATEAEGLRSKTSELEDALARLSGRTPTVEEAQRAFNGTLTDAAKQVTNAKGKVEAYAASLINSKGAIDLTTEAGQQLYDNTTASAKAAQDAAIAQAALAGKTQGTAGAADAAIRSLAASRKAFIDNAKQMGLTAEQAKKLADRYFGLPKNIEILVRGKSDFSAVDNKLQALADRKITVDVQGVYRAPRGLPARSFGNANAGLAGGGAITGPGTKGVDSKLTMLAPGEHVLTASDVDALGGQSAVYALRSALHGGVSSFATGGATSPGVRSLSGMSAPQLGPVASILAQALDGIDQAVQETSQSAADAADKLRSANDAYKSAVADQTQTAKDQAARVKDVNTSTQQAIKDQKSRLADAKTAAAQSIKDAAARLREAKSDTTRASAERSLANARTSGAKKVADAEKKLQDARDARVKKLRDAIRAESTANAKAASKTSQSLSALTSARSASATATRQDLLTGIASGSVADARTLGASRVAAQVSRQQSVARAQQANVARVDKATTAAITAAKSRLDELRKSSGGSAAALAHIATAERNVKKAQDARVVSLRNAIRTQTAANKAEAARTAQTRASAASLVTQAKNAASAQAAQSKLASMLDKTNDSLADATSKLADLRQQSAQLSSSVSSKIQGDTSIMGMDAQGVPGLLAGLKSNLASATAFGSDLRSLRARGLDTGILTDIAGGGLAAGPLASALAHASGGQINQLNRLQAQIRAVSGSTGDLVANANFGSQISSESKVVAAYQQTSKDLTSLMAANAKSLNAALEAGLKGMVVQVQMDGKTIDARINKIISTQGRTLLSV